MRKIYTLITVLLAIISTSLHAQYDSLDTDGDAVPDIIDRDDDNDGIIDEFECNEWAGLTPDNVTGMDFSQDEFVLLFPSDFGLDPTIDQTNINLEKDFSSLYGLPTGSIIVKLSNVSILEGTDRFYTTESTGPTTLELSGSYPTALQVEQGQEFDANGLTKTINFPNEGISVILDNSSSAPSGGTITQSGNAFIGTWNSAQSTNAFLISKRIPSAYNGKKVEFDLDDNVAGNDLYTTFFFRFKPICDYDSDNVPDIHDLDSDNDGCLDAIEGESLSSGDFPGTIPNDDTVVETHLVASSGDASVGTGSAASNENFCGSSTCVFDSNAAFPGVVSKSGNYWYQHVGSSQDASVTSIVCTTTPISYKSFEVEAQELTASLSWTTSSETDNSHFEIYRSVNGRSWTYVDKVDGIGHSTQDFNYTYHDENIGTKYSDLYYRLKQVDYDGSFAYSNIQKVIFDNNAKGFDIYPNPANDRLWISLPHKRDNKYQFELYNTAGQLIVKSKKDQIDLSSVHPGVYQLRIKSQNNVLFGTKRVVVIK